MQCDLAMRRLALLIGGGAEPLLESGEQDVAVIAKAAGMGNPRRVYVLRKQIRGRHPGQLLGLLRRVLEVEAALKRGTDPAAAFRDGFLPGADAA